MAAKLKANEVVFLIMGWVRIGITIFRNLLFFQFLGVACRWSNGLRLIRHANSLFDTGLRDIRVRRAWRQGRVGKIAGTSYADSQKEKIRPEPV
jgi:hypothetical protein